MIFSLSIYYGKALKYLFPKKVISLRDLFELMYIDLFGSIKIVSMTKDMVLS